MGSFLISVFIMQLLVTGRVCSGCFWKERWKYGGEEVERGGRGETKTEGGTKEGREEDCTGRTEGRNGRRKYAYAGLRIYSEE